jgi:hypothetical protein
MRGLLLASVLLFATTSCEQQPPTAVPGSVVVTKVDGVVKTVKVDFPHYVTNSGQNPTIYGPMTLTNREEIDDLMKNLEGMLTDLKGAQGEMKVIEPPVAKPKK